MHTPLQALVALLPVLGLCSPKVKRATLPPHWSVRLLGNNTSNFPNIYRDGGGGGKIAGYNYINFADGTVTTGGYPRADGSNTKGFISNSIVLAGLGTQGGGPRNFFDFGSNGIPKQQVPYFSDENPFDYGIWPNANIATLCGGNCGVAFYPVVDRNNGGSYRYGTGVNITAGFQPAVVRPVKALFSATEVGYGLFSSLPLSDGFLYMFGSVSNTQNSNGLKLARVPQGTCFTRGYYQYWTGSEWSFSVTKYDDNGRANVFNHSTTLPNGQKLGPASGDIFYSNFYRVYMMLFQSVGIDPNFYMSYSSRLTGGWSTPVAVYKTPTLDSYNYAIHAYPHFDETQRVIPISWTQQGIYTNPKGTALGYFSFANITFS